MTDDTMRPATRIVRTAEPSGPQPASVTTPIYASTTFVFASAAEVRAHAEGRSDRYFYSRYANPTVAAVERQLASLEGGDAARLFASGMAATSTALLTLLGAGDEVVCSSAAYGGTLRLLRDVLPRFGIRTRFVPTAVLSERPESVLSATTRVLWFETPINPTLRCLDIRAITAACQAQRVISVVDNTFATPITQTPLALGADVCMHSATKYLNGHSDVTAGALIASTALIQQFDETRKLLGGVIDPVAAYALGRGLKTLDVRMARHNANAAAVARFLDQDARVARVLYPGLPSHPDHAVARSQMRGFGGMVCLELAGGYERAARFFDRLTVIARAASLGGVESLCSLPVLTSHFGVSPEALAEAGVSEGMARLSVGLEDPADLIADLDRALG